MGVQLWCEVDREERSLQTLDVRPLLVWLGGIWPDGVAYTRSAFGFEEYDDAMIAVEGVNGIKMEAWSQVVGTSVSLSNVLACSTTRLTVPSCGQFAFSDEHYFANTGESLYNHGETHTRVWIDYPSDFVRPALALADAAPLAPLSRRNPVASRVRAASEAPVFLVDEQGGTHAHATRQPPQPQQPQQPQQQQQQQVTVSQKTSSPSASSRQCTAQPSPLLGFGGSPEVDDLYDGSRSPLSRGPDIGPLDSVKEEDEDDLLFEDELFASPVTAASGAPVTATDRQNDERRTGDGMGMRVKGASLQAGNVSRPTRVDQAGHAPAQIDHRREEEHGRRKQDGVSDRRDERVGSDQRGGAGGGGRHVSPARPEAGHSSVYDRRPQQPKNRDDRQPNNRKDRRPPPRDRRSPRDERPAPRDRLLSPRDDRFARPLPRDDRFEARAPCAPSSYNQNHPQPSYDRSSSRYEPYRRPTPERDGPLVRSDRSQRSPLRERPDRDRDAHYSQGPSVSRSHSREAQGPETGPSDRRQTGATDSKATGPSSHTSLRDRLAPPRSDATEDPTPTSGSSTSGQVADSTRIRNNRSNEDAKSAEVEKDKAARLESIKHIKRSWNREWVTVDFNEDDSVHVLNVPKSSLPYTENDTLLSLMDALDAVLPLEPHEMCAAATFHEELAR